jgi:Tol biopolymer transport system component
LGAALASVADAQITSGRAASEPRYTIAFASFAPLNADIFIAAADGSDARPLLAHPELDYNASFSPDGQGVVFTSTRSGSADIYRARLDGSGIEQLTDDPAFDDQGVLSPDGESLAFVSSRSGQADIWILDVATGALRNLTNHAGGDFRPSWSPDGEWIAFSTDRDSTRPKFSFATLHSTELYIVRADGTGLRRVTELNAFAGSPAWSADGKRLIYYEADIAEVQKIRSPLRLRGTTQIARVDLATNERQALTDGAGEKSSPRWLPNGRIGFASGGPEGGVEFTTGSAGVRGEIRNPSWSPDGRRMVFHRDAGGQWPPLRAWPSRDPMFGLVRTGVFPSSSPGGDRLVVNDEKAASLHNNIVVMSMDGTERTVVFGDPVRNALAPVWSPAGDRIAFGIGRFFQSSQGAGTADIAVMCVDGTELRTLTDGSGNYGLPAWSPDGRELVYRTSGTDRNGLSIIDVASGAVTTLTDGSSHDNFASWSPDGERIAFTSDRDGDYEIYTIRRDSTDLRRLTRTPGNDAHNAWSPDGEWIVFASERGGFKDESPLHPHNPQAYGDLYVVRADGSEVRMLTDDQFEDGTPSFVSAPSQASTDLAQSGDGITPSRCFTNAADPR